MDNIDNKNDDNYDAICECMSCTASTPLGFCFLALQQLFILVVIMGFTGLLAYIFPM